MERPLRETSITKSQSTEMETQRKAPRERPNWIRLTFYPRPTSFLLVLQQPQILSLFSLGESSDDNQ